MPSKSSIQFCDIAFKFSLSLLFCKCCRCAHWLLVSITIQLVHLRKWFLGGVCVLSDEFESTNQPSNQHTKKWNHYHYQRRFFILSYATCVLNACRRRERKKNGLECVCPFISLDKLCRQHTPTRIEPEKMAHGFNELEIFSLNNYNNL